MTELTGATDVPIDGRTADAMIDGGPGSAVAPTISVVSCVFVAVCVVMMVVDGPGGSAILGLVGAGLSIASLVLARRRAAARTMAIVSVLLALPVFVVSLGWTTIYAALDLHDPYYYSQSVAPAPAYISGPVRDSNNISWSVLWWNESTDAATGTNQLIIQVEIVNRDPQGQVVLVDPAGIELVDSQGNVWKLTRVPTPQSLVIGQVATMNLQYAVPVDHATDLRLRIPDDDGGPPAELLVDPSGVKR